MEVDILDEFERKLEDNDINKSELENEFDDIFDNLYQGCAISAKDYVALREDCIAKFNNIISKH